MRTDLHDRPSPHAPDARVHDMDESMSTSGYELSRAASPCGPGGVNGHDADEDPSQSAEGSVSPPFPSARGGTAMYPPGPSSRIASESSASRSNTGHPSLRAHATHPHHHGHHHHHPILPSAERNPIVSSSRLHEFLARQEDAGREAARQQPAASAEHAAPRPRKGKGKALAEASSGSDAADSYEESGIPPRVHIVPVVDPDDSPYYPDSGATSDENLGAQKAPIRIRRVGALGISVSSDAGEELAGNSDDSPPRWSADDEEGIAAAPRGGITDAHFRGIVDELSLQNQALKGRLRRYEAARVPAQLKKERLFEVRFFDGMPSEKREEIEGFLTRYVQGLADLPTPTPTTAATPAPTLSPPISAPAKPTRESPRSTRRRHHHQSSILIPSHHAAADPSTPSSDEEKAWAGPSFSGVEPTSFTGTGTGMRISASGMERRPVATGGTSLETRGDHKNAFEIVDVLERFFEGALTQPATDSSGTNEAYLSHLLDNASLAAGGWTYLNLVNTMSQVHRFNVTLPFIQTALRTYSTKLEVSADGAKVRWVGVKPVLLRRISHGSAPSVHSNSDLNSATGSAETLTSSSGGVVIKSASTAATSVQSKPTTVTSHPSHRIRPAPVPVQPGLHLTSILGTESSSVAPKVPSYVPFFKGSQQDSDDSTPSSGSGSGSRNPYSVDGTGTMVFYSNGNFCSDLSTDVYGLAESADTVLALGEKRLPPNELDDGPSVFTTGLTTIVESPSTSNLSDHDLEFVDGEEQAADDDDESAMEEHPLLPISGMTEVVPSDLFTINIQTARAPPRSSMKRPADSPVAGPRKRVRVVATSTELHDSVIPARRNSLGRVSRATSPDASSTAISQLRTNQASPSLPDYLLSLSLPLYSWAPRETCLVLQRPGNSAEPSSASEDDSQSNAGLSFVA